MSEKTPLEEALDKAVDLQRQLAEANRVGWALAEALLKAREDCSCQLGEDYDPAHPRTVVMADGTRQPCGACAASDAVVPEARKQGWLP